MRKKLGLLVLVTFMLTAGAACSQPAADADTTTDINSTEDTASATDTNSVAGKSSAGKEETKNRTDCEELRPYLESAERMLKDICQKYSRNVLLHGDLHHENILKNENGGYTVIDPKGVVGDPVFDLSRFILDEFRDNLVSEPKEIVLDFVKNLGADVGIPPETLLRCLYIETVIWLFREELATGESLEECEQLITNMKTAYEFVCDVLE